MTVESRTFRVTAIGPHGAQVAGVRLARSQGLVVRTTSRITLVTTGVPLALRDTAPLLWDVTCAVVVPG